jgi:ribonucleotide monophosphatase NagD (HAD superfamily)
MIGYNYIADIVGAKSNGIQGILVRSEKQIQP